MKKNFAFLAILAMMLAMIIAAPAFAKDCPQMGEVTDHSFLKQDEALIPDGAVGQSVVMTLCSYLAADGKIALEAGDFIFTDRNDKFTANPAHLAGATDRNYKFKASPANSAGGGQSGEVVSCISSEPSSYAAYAAGSPQAEFARLVRTVTASVPGAVSDHYFGKCRMAPIIHI